MFTLMEGRGRGKERAERGQMSECLSWFDVAPASDTKRQAEGAGPKQEAVQLKSFFMDLHTAVKFEGQPAARAVGKQTVEGAGH